MASGGRVVGAVVISWLGCATPRAEPQAQPTALESQQQVRADDALPPAVLHGDAELHCNISSSANGHQTFRLNVPSLRGCRYTPPYFRDGRAASLEGLVQQIVTGELDGEPLSQRELAALVRYVLELDFLPNANLDARNRLSARASAPRRAGHPASAFFRDGRVHRIGSGSPPSPHAIDGGYETPTLLGLAETAPYFHDGRCASLDEVVAWFDREYGLQLSTQDQADLVAYLHAVGAVDRPADDRPLARRLDQTFAYASLLTAARPRRIWIAALELLAAVLPDAPGAVAKRAVALQRELTSLGEQVRSGAPLAPLAQRASPLRGQLARLAADWAGAASPAVAERTDAAR